MQMLCPDGQDCLADYYTDEVDTRCHTGCLRKATRIPSPEVRERLSRVTAADLAAELELRRAQDIRNENRYQREQGWLDVVSRMREALDMESSPTVSRGSVIDWLNTIHDRLRDLPVPKLPDQ